MAIESSANDISQLNQNFPTAEDFVSEGDDHIRLIKKTLKNTFYKIKGVCGISHHQLSTLGSAIKDVTSDNEVILYDTVKVKKSGLVEAKTITRHSEGNANTVVTVGTMINLLYPVGSVYITTNNTNPKDLFGIGEWSAYAQGRALVGVGNLDGTNIGGGQEFGKKQTILNEQNLPAHTHSKEGLRITGGAHKHTATFDATIDNGENSGGEHYLRPKGQGGRGHIKTTYETDGTGEHNHNLEGEIGMTGTGLPFDNYQPSLGIYVWKRIR